MSEPVVLGSVRALRTFRLLRGGGLAPVSARSPWTAGVNTATCDRKGSVRGHRPPEPGCSCGLWAFGGLQALRESDLREQDAVVAVVRCHGRVVPATLGLRAEHGVLEALWLSPEVAATAGTGLAATYPQAAVYRSLPAMLAEHPLSVLPSYRLPTAPRRALVHLQLLVTAAWWAGMLTWMLLALPVQRPVGAPPSGLEPLALTVPLVVAGVTVLVLRTPSRWAWGLVALAVQSGLAVGASLLLSPWVAFEELSAVAGAAGTLHVLTAYRAWRLRLGRPARAGRTAAT